MYDDHNFYNNELSAPTNAPNWTIDGYRGPLYDDVNKACFQRSSNKPVSIAGNCLGGRSHIIDDEPNNDEQVKCIFESLYIIAFYFLEYAEIKSRYDDGHGAI